MPSAHVLGVFCTCYLEPSIVFKAKVARHVRMLIWYLFIIDKCHGCLSTWITILKWGNFSIISFQCRVLSTMDCLYVLFPGHYIVCPWIFGFWLFLWYLQTVLPTQGLGFRRPVCWQCRAFLLQQFRYSWYNSNITENNDKQQYPNDRLYLWVSLIFGTMFPSFQLSAM